MKALVITLTEHPRLVSTLGAISGWFSVDRLGKAKEVAQIGAAMLAMMVSVCALILTAPAAWAKVKAWWSVCR